MAIAAGLAGAGLASSIYGGITANKMQKRALGEYQAQIAAAVAELEKVGIPSIEAQRIILQSPELVGLENIPEQIRSEFATIETNPELKDLQYRNLHKLEESADTGMTETEALNREMEGRKVSSEAQARKGQILQELGARGQRGGGQELALQQMANQDSMNRLEMEGLARRASAEQNRLSALGQLSNVAGSMQASEFGQAAQKAGAIERLNQSNLGNRMSVEQRNLQRRQDLENVRTGTSNQQEMHNKALIQQDYQNRINKAQAIANARTGGASNVMAGQNALAQGQRQMYGGIGQGLMQMGGAFAGQSSKTNKDPSDVSGFQFDQNEEGTVSNPRNADGGLIHAEDGNFESSGEGDVATTGDGNFAGDRVDAKINEGEMIINIPQQQRLLELLQGYRSLEDLGDEPLVMDKSGQAPQPMQGDTPPIKMANGGRVKNNDDGLARGMMDEYAKMSEHDNKLKEASGNTRKRIKALEVLLNVNKKIRK